MLGPHSILQHTQFIISDPKILYDLSYCTAVEEKSQTKTESIICWRRGEGRKVLTILLFKHLSHVYSIFKPAPTTQSSPAWNASNPFSMCCCEGPVTILRTSSMSGRNSQLLIHHAPAQPLTTPTTSPGLIPRRIYLYHHTHTQKIAPFTQKNSTIRADLSNSGD